VNNAAPSSILFAAPEPSNEAADPSEEKTMVRPDTNNAPRGSRPRVSYTVGEQRGEHINNVGRDQYNQYVQQIRQERASFLAAVAAARTRARRLALLGFLLILGGGGVYGWVLLRSVTSIFDTVSSASRDPDSDFSANIPDLLGEKIHGVPIGVLGFAAVAVGTVLMVIGIVMHVSTTARSRRGDTEFINALSMTPYPQ
jgi:hypothetical protein